MSTATIAPSAPEAREDDVARAGRARHRNVGARPARRGRRRRSRRTRRAGLAALVLAVVLPGLLVAGALTSRWRVVTVLTDSMAPRMPAGTLLLVVAHPATDLRPGDVLVYEPPVGPRRTISHRVVTVRPENDGTIAVTTKGDANTAPDPWVAEIRPGRVWTVAAALPGIGRAIHVLEQPATFALARYALPAVALVWFLAGLGKAEARPREETRRPGRHAGRPGRRRGAARVLRSRR
jgi:signal peptidase I